MDQVTGGYKLTTPKIWYPLEAQLQCSVQPHGGSKASVSSLASSHIQRRRLSSKNMEMFLKWKNKKGYVDLPSPKDFFFFLIKLHGQKG